MLKMAHPLFYDVFLASYFHIDIAVATNKHN